MSKNRKKKNIKNLKNNKKPGINRQKYRKNRQK